MVDAAFLALSVITIGSAIAALELRSMIYGSMVMMGLGSIIIDSGLRTIQTNEPAVDFRDIGEDFLTYYWPALILMALILAGAVTGALVLARREDVEDEQRAN